MYTKAVVLIAGILLFGVAAFAQSSGNGGQTISLQLQPVIDISFIQLNAVGQNFNATVAMSNGKTADCGISVNANKRFLVSIEPVAVKQDAQKLDDKFSVLVADSRANNEVSGSAFKLHTKATTKNPLVKNCENGSDQQFYVAYQTSNEKNSLMNTMAGNVVYTATLP